MRRTIQSNDRRGSARFLNQRWVAESMLRDREVTVKERKAHCKERELALKEVELREGRWRNPLVVGIVAAALAAAGNAYVAYHNAAAQRQIEAEKAEQERILEMIKTGDRDSAAENLRFLIESGLIVNQELRDRLEKFLDSRKSNTGPALPAATVPAPAPAPVAVKERLYFRGGETALDEEHLAALERMHAKLGGGVVELILITQARDLSEGGQMRVAIERAKAVKAFFLGKGIDEKRVYTDLRGLVDAPRTPAGAGVGPHIDVEIVGQRPPAGSRSLLSR